MSEELLPQKFFPLLAGSTFDFWVRKSISIENKEEVVIVSPYLGNALVEIISQLEKNGCSLVKIYTLFNFKVFAEGSSNFMAVKEVFEKSICHFFHVENLHSKFILFGKTSAIFGSQNVSKAGKFNHEFNCLTTDDDFLRQIRMTANKLASVAQPVTKAWFQLIEDHLEEVKVGFEEVFQKCEEIEEKIQEENVKAAEAAKKAKSLRMVKNSLKDLETKTTWYRTSNFLGGIYLKKNNGSKNKWRLVHLDSWNRPSLLNWGTGTNFDEQSCQRFFCLFQDKENSIPLTGFARMTKNGVSFIANGFNGSDVVVPKSLSMFGSWKIDISGLIPDQSNSCNLRVEFKGLESFVKFDCLFLGHHLILNSTIESSGPFGKPFKEKIDGNREALKKCLIEALMNPFKYIDGKKIHDTNRLHEILGSTNIERWKLRLGTPHSCPGYYFFYFQALP